MASQPLIICFPDKEGCGGQTTAMMKIKAVVFSVWLEICCVIPGLRPICKRKLFKGEVFSVSSSLRPEF